VTTGIEEAGVRWATALAFPLRVQILDRLVAERVASPIELAEHLGITQSVARYHLQRLQRLGVVALGTRPPGRSTTRQHYYLADREATMLALEHAGDLAHFAAGTDRRIDPKTARALIALGGALRAVRERRGVTISDLAYRAGLTPAVLERIECGEADPRMTVVLRLAYAVELTLRDVLRQAGAGDRRWG
jgi:DNA-binding transcriptional ArsR family regulator